MADLELVVPVFVPAPPGARARDPVTLIAFPSTPKNPIWLIEDFLELRFGIYIPVDFSYAKQVYTVTFDDNTMAKEVLGGYFCPSECETIFFLPFDSPAEAADAEVFNDLDNIAEL